MNLENFTERAKKVLQLANQEAQRAGRERVEAEHILLALLIEGRGVGASVLKNMGVDLARARSEVQRLAGGEDRGTKATDKQLALSEGAHRIVERASQESTALNHRYVGTEHLL